MTKTKMLNNIKDELQKCNKCRICTSQQVFFTGNPNAKIMFVGEAPGREEVKECKPFVGGAGKNLTKYLEQVGIDRENDLYITNVVKCRPTKEDNPNKNKTPDLNEINACVHFLFDELEIVQPKLIVLCGATAYKGLTGKNSVTMGKIRGKIFQLEINGKSYDAITIYHPSYLMQYASPAQIDVTIEDLKVIKTYL